MKTTKKPPTRTLNPIRNPGKTGKGATKPEAKSKKAGWKAEHPLNPMPNRKVPTHPLNPIAQPPVPAKPIVMVNPIAQPPVPAKPIVSVNPMPQPAKKIEYYK